MRLIWQTTERCRQKTTCAAHPATATGPAEEQIARITDGLAAACLPEMRVCRLVVTVVLGAALLCEITGCSARLTPRDSVVISVSTSRLWLNYRHVVDEAIFEQAALQHGTAPSSMAAVSADAAVSDLSSNMAPGQAFCQYTKTHDVLERASQSYWALHGSRTTAQALLGLLGGRPTGPLGFQAAFRASSGSWGVPMTVAAARDANSDQRVQTNRSLFVYLNGHGGDGFLKVHDSAVVSGSDIAWALAELRARAETESAPSLIEGSAGESPVVAQSLLILDTCQAGSLWDPIPASWGPVWGTSPGGKSSYARPADSGLGVSPSDAMAGASHVRLAQSALAGRAAAQGALQRLVAGDGRSLQHPLEAAASATDSLGRWRADLPASVIMSQLVVRPRGVVAAPDGQVKGGNEAEAGEASEIERWMNRSMGDEAVGGAGDIESSWGAILGWKTAAGEATAVPSEPILQRARAADSEGAAVTLAELLQARPRTSLARPGDSSLGVADALWTGLSVQLSTDAQSATASREVSRPSWRREPLHVNRLDWLGLRLTVWMAVLFVVSLLLLV